MATERKADQKRRLVDAAGWPHHCPGQGRYAAHKEIDKLGNDAADELAVAGAVSNKFRRHEVQQKRKALRTAMR
eukprot:3925102-Karenia_brevis.AAC.1